MEVAGLYLCPFVVLDIPGVKEAVWLKKLCDEEAVHKM